MSITKDDIHREHMKRIAAERPGEFGFYETRCFCGGQISQMPTGPESWETSCMNCNFLYDED